MRYVILPLLLTASLLSASQDKVFKFRSYQFIYMQRPAKVEAKESDWIPTNVLVAIYFRDDEVYRIKIFSAEEKSFDVTHTKDMSKDGNTSYDYNTLDQDGISCKVSITMYDANRPNYNPKHHATLMITYNSAYIAYRLRWADLDEPKAP